MYIMQTISAERSREMREQAAAGRRARETRRAMHARPARNPLAVIARNGRSLAWHKPLQGRAAA